MPQIGPLEIMVVAAVALIVFGPQKLPGIARSVGRFLSEMRRMASDARSEFEAGLSLDEVEDEKPGPHDEVDATTGDDAVESRAADGDTARVTSEAPPED